MAVFDYEKERRKLTIKEFAKGFYLAKIATDDKEFYKPSKIDEFADKIYEDCKTNSALKNAIAKEMNGVNTVVNNKLHNFNFLSMLEDVEDDNNYSYYFLKGSPEEIKRLYKDNISGKLNKMLNDAFEESKEIEK